MVAMLKGGTGFTVSSQIILSLSSSPYDLRSNNVCHSLRSNSFCSVVGGRHLRYGHSSRKMKNRQQLYLPVCFFLTDCLPEEKPPGKGNSSNVLHTSLPFFFRKVNLVKSLPRKLEIVSSGNHRLGRFFFLSLFMVALTLSPWPQLAHAVLPSLIDDKISSEKDNDEKRIRFLEEIRGEREEKREKRNEEERKKERREREREERIRRRQERGEPRAKLEEELENKIEYLEDQIESHWERFENLKQSLTSEVDQGSKSDKLSQMIEQDMEEFRSRMNNGIEYLKLDSSVKIEEENLANSEGLEQNETLQERIRALNSLHEVVSKRKANYPNFVNRVAEVSQAMFVERARLQSESLINAESSLVSLRGEAVRLANKIGKIAEDYMEVEQRMAQPLQSEIEKQMMIAEKLEQEYKEVWDNLKMVIELIWQKEFKGSQVAFSLPNLDLQAKTVLSQIWKENRPARQKKKDVKKEVKVDEVVVLKELQEAYEEARKQKLLLESVKVEVDKEQSGDRNSRVLVQAYRQELEKFRNMQKDVDAMFIDVFQELIPYLKEKRDILERIATEDAFTVLRQYDDENEFRIPEDVLDKSFAALKQWREKYQQGTRKVQDNTTEVSRTLVQNILEARDAVMSSVIYNESHKRWEILPEGVEQANLTGLLERVVFRHDDAVMFIKLKGDDREYYSDIEVFDASCSDNGGITAFKMSLMANGIPTIYKQMWIPFDQWPPLNLVLFPFKLVVREVFAVLGLVIKTPVTIWYFKVLAGSVDELMIRFGFPFLELAPTQVQKLIGLICELGDSTFLSEWKQRAKKSNDLRYERSKFVWWISLPVRCYVAWVPLSILYKPLVHLTPRPHEHFNEAEWKENEEEKILKEQKLKESKESLDPIKQSFSRMKKVKQADYKLENFYGFESIKEEIKEIVTFLQNPLLFKEMGAKPPRGVLITGETGSGKTAIAMAIAAEARVPMVELTAMELEGGAWVGQGASNVRELFKTARELAPMIIFIDDFDFFAGIRGQTGNTKKQDHESMINQLLVELDGFETQEGVILLATSTNPEMIDEALRRPGRMDRTILVPLPNKSEREAILRAAAQNVLDPYVIGLVDWGEVARKTELLSPEALKRVPAGLKINFYAGKFTDDEELHNILGWTSMLDNIIPEGVRGSKFVVNWKQRLLDWLDLRISDADIEAAVESLDVYGESKPGLELYAPGNVWTREYKYPHAVWAVGRGLICILIPNFDSVEKIWLDRNSFEGIGFTKITKRLEEGFEETDTVTRSYLEKRLVTCFGSFVASDLLLAFGENNNLCRYEIEEAKKIATAMVLECGWGPDDSQVIYCFDRKALTLSMGDEVEREMNSKIEKLFYHALDKAKDLFQKNRALLDAFLEHILRYDSLTKKDIARLISEHGVVFAEEPFMLVPYTREEARGDTLNGSGRKPLLQMTMTS